MHDFRYKSGKLYCEGVSVEKIARKVGTPVYIYSKKTLRDHYRKLKDAFVSVKPLICFSMKANSNLSVCRTLVREGSGLDVVSGGELYRALLTGVNPQKVVYAGVGKTEKEVRQAIRARILFFNVESMPELELINKVARSMRRRADLCIRVNPDVSAHTHHYITTGTEENKFGIDFHAAKALFRRAKDFPNVRIVGLHVHIGSQITIAAPFKKTIKKVFSFIDANRLDVKYLNIGGGLGIVYDKEKPQSALKFADAILPILRKRRGLGIILEPGRFIAGNAGILLTRVTYIKKARRKRFAIVDAGMNDLVRPSLYDAHHTILPAHAKKRRREVYDIVGPICESGDFLAKKRRIESLASGDLLAVMGAGAYGFTMSSNYNSRPRAAEVLVNGGRFSVVRRRETYADLVKYE
ncbi:MAG: diaminopimelate decarboxylase [Candidatus Omnitrophica bacterium]|nr:diaminopimelate decarboxylase [Candidatus Omnitrophota bacterium]